MKKTKHSKLLIAYLFVLILSLCFISPVYAVETNFDLTCVDLSEKFGLGIEAVSGAQNTYKIYMSGDGCGTKDEINNAKLQVIAINNVAVQNGEILEKNKEIRITANLVRISANESVVSVTLKDTNSTEEVGSTVTIKYGITSEQPVVSAMNKEDNTNYNGICKIFRDGNGYESNAKLKSALTKAEFDKYNYAVVNAEGKRFYQESLNYCFQPQVIKGTNYTEEQTANVIANIVTLWKIYSSQYTPQNNSFALDFAAIKAKALSKGTANTPVNPSANKFDLKCSYNQPVQKDSSGNEYIQNEYGDVIYATDYYKNKDYFYSTSKEKILRQRYVYNYAPGNTVVDEKNVCERTCEEAVKVEYGPPVASKAGLCFEYKVKVTSYVQCNVKMDFNPPKQDTSYCNPGPECRDIYGNLRTWRPQAGPSEDYDLCISKCDGGKYSSECSQKCYKEVYESKQLTQLALNFETKPAIQLAANNSYTLEQCLKDNKDYDGCYSKRNGTITWTALNYNSASVNSLGRWYSDRYRKHGNNYGAGGYDVSGLATGTYFADRNGFYRRDYGSTVCSDICTWLDSCPAGSYLNPGTAAKDYVENMAEYHRLQQSCVAKATCTTNLTEFTIAVKYDTKNNENITVNKVYFPYTSTVKDPIENASEYNTVAKEFLNTQGSITPNKTTSPIISYDGCYKDRNVGNKYMTEWSFPGTFIHNKTGEISFEEPSDLSGWYEENRKFCMPLNSQTVNPKWWEWKKLGSSCYSLAEIEEELKGKAGTSNGYNIEAITSKFGYYGWNFNIKCFYATKNEACKVDETGCCAKENTSNIIESNGSTNYRVRSVDINNIFPNSKEAGVLVDNNTRDVGFNWSSKAQVLTIKNPNYHVNPTELIEHIQNNASTLYEDESNLDYQFYLTPTTLNKIRNYNSNKSYSTWNGTTFEKNGIMVYSSNLFRDTGVEGGLLTSVDGAILKTGTLGVNNE